MEMKKANYNLKWVISKIKIKYIYWKNTFHSFFFKFYSDNKCYLYSFGLNFFSKYPVIAHPIKYPIKYQTRQLKEMKCIIFKLQNIVSQITSIIFIPISWQKSLQDNANENKWHLKNNTLLIQCLSRIHIFVFICSSTLYPWHIRYEQV